jgi:hypothetical protein
VEEAERAFREDLGFAKDYPRRKAKLNNVWGLHGLHEALTRVGKADEAIILKNQLDLAAASADVDVSVSCYCRNAGAAEEESCCK